MERSMLLDETINVRRTILAKNAELVADHRDFIPGQVAKEEAALKFALHLLDHAESIFESDQCQAIISVGIAIGIIVDRGMVILEPSKEPDLLLMQQANVLPI